MFSYCLLPSYPPFSLLKFGVIDHDELRWNHWLRPVGNHIKGLYENNCSVFNFTLIFDRTLRRGVKIIVLLFVPQLVYFLVFVFLCIPFFVGALLVPSLLPWVVVGKVRDSDLVSIVKVGDTHWPSPCPEIRVRLDSLTSDGRTPTSTEGPTVSSPEIFRTTIVLSRLVGDVTDGETLHLLRTVVINFG